MSGLSFSKLSFGGEPDTVVQVLKLPAPAVSGAAGWNGCLCWRPARFSCRQNAKIAFVGPNGSLSTTIAATSRPSQYSRLLKDSVLSFQGLPLLSLYVLGVSWVDESAHEDMNLHLGRRGGMTGAEVAAFRLLLGSQDLRKPFTFL